MIDAFPLQWPEGWPRTPAHQRQSGNRFKQGKNSYGWAAPATFGAARDKLYAELDRLGARNVVLSSNHKTNSRNEPSETRGVKDHAVAAYFTLKGKQLVMASDRYDSAAGNMSSIRLAIEAMRQLDRHGGGTMMERAFAGFEALPSPEMEQQQTCWEVLGLAPDCRSAEHIDAAFRQLAKERHPDKPGGSTAAMQKLSWARALAHDLVQGTIR